MKIIFNIIIDKRYFILQNLLNNHNFDNTNFYLSYFTTYLLNFIWLRKLRPEAWRLGRVV